jgi:hypothetical protein
MKRWSIGIYYPQEEHPDGKHRWCSLQALPNLVESSALKGQLCFRRGGGSSEERMIERYVSSSSMRFKGG